MRAFEGEEVGELKENLRYITAKVVEVGAPPVRHYV